MIISIAIVAMLFAAASAQQSVFKGTSSAGVIGDTVKFNCDFIDPIGLPAIDLIMHYKGQSQSDFSEITMTHIQGDPHYLLTSECGLQFGASQGIIQYYFSGGTDTFMLSQSPFYTGTQWPAQGLFADFAGDPNGDTLAGTPGSWLDLTGSGMTYSNTKIYGYLSNVTGNWPANQGLTALYLYGLALIAPSIQQQNIYAMIYINLWPLISPGLYKINVADSAFTRIGDVSYTISGGRLFMSCNIADLTNDPDWPGWPPPNGYIITLGTTATGSLTTPTLNDYTLPTFYEPKTRFLDFAQNSPPRIYDPGFNEIPELSLTAHIKYYDPDNNLPKIRRLYFDRGIFDMGSLDHVYLDTATFDYTLAWPSEGYHYYYFVFSDGRDTTRTLADSLYVSGVGIDNPPVVADAFSLAQNYPNPFNGSTMIAFFLSQTGNVKLTISDLAGRQVTILADSPMQAGRHDIVWSDRDNMGNSVSSGIYFYTLTVGDRSSSRSMVYLK
jgi:hypothetical protein